MIETNYFCWKLRNSVKHECRLSTESFESVLGDEIFNHMCRETSKCASKRGDNTLNLHKQELRSFMAVLTLSGYIDLPQCFMY